MSVDFQKVNADSNMVIPESINYSGIEQSMDKSHAHLALLETISCVIGEYSTLLAGNTAVNLSGFVLDRLYVELKVLIKSMYGEHYGLIDKIEEIKRANAETGKSKHSLEK